VSTNGSVCIRGEIDDEVLEDVMQNRMLKITVQGNVETIGVLHVKKKKGSTFLRLSKHFGIGKKVYVHGPFAVCKTVDTNFLLMTLFNAVKALASK